MKRDKITDEQLRAIVDSEIRNSMGEQGGGTSGGELANERAQAMDYYLGEAVGKLNQTNPDRSSVVITTTRDTIEWLMPQLMRMFAQADAVVEFDSVGQEDEQAAKQETQAINHIFWRKNEGFLLLYSWFKDALIQKNGIVKYWVEKSGENFEEYEDLTEQGIFQMISSGEYEALEQEISETPSIDGQPLYHVKFKKLSQKQIVIEVIPPEEFIISSDPRSLDIQSKPPRFCGHYPEKTESELLDMGFTQDEVAEFLRGDERWHELSQEWLARYHLTDEKEHLHNEPQHESLKKIRYIEGYMNLDMDGDGYAELIRVYRGGDHLSWEEVDSRPFSALTPNILTHKFFGQSINDLVKDLQEISTATMRNVLDNMYQVNNTRPVVNNRVDTDSLLTSRPGAPIYIDDSAPVSDAVQPFAPPPVWKDGLTVLEYIDGIRKDRTGVGDETMGLDPGTLGSANTGVVLQAMEAAQAKIELIARIFAETGMKWLFRDLHELCRKHYDQPIRYKLQGEYHAVRPQEWRERTDMTVNVGTATGNRQQNLFALMQIAQIQEAMVRGGLMGKTVLPSNIYQTGKSIAENLGQWGDKFFLNPKLLNDPSVQEIIQMQMPQPQGPDPQVAALEMNAQIEGMKAEVSREKNRREADLKAQELDLKRAELVGKREMEALKFGVQDEIKKLEESTERDKMQVEAGTKIMEMELKNKEQDLKGEIAQLNAQVEVLKTMTQVDPDIFDVNRLSEKEAKKESDMQQLGQDFEEKILNMHTQLSSAFKSQLDNIQEQIKDVDKTSQDRTFTVISSMVSDIQELVKQLPEIISSTTVSAIAQNSSKPKEVIYDNEGRIVRIQ